MSTTPSREEALFSDAVAQPPDRREEFIARACGADAALLARIAGLVGAHDGPESLALAPGAERPFALLEEKPGDVIGHYTLRQKIGEGGCGVVWMAEQDEPVRRRVALKVIKLGMDTKAVVARFEAERQALAMMDHPNIAKVYDAGSTETGRPYFVMELVRGILITKYCDENQLTPAERLELFIKVCRAVQHAHHKGIIHRDLKPSNILVTVNDGAPTPKIIDFGIAKATQGRLTDATLFTTFEQFIGTPVYMSPEQAEMGSLDIDTRSDIYSLGVLLYELLAGRPPFDPKAFARAGVAEIRHHIRDDELPKPSTRWRTLAEAERSTLARQRSTAPGQLSVILRGDLDWIVMRCIEKDRTRRYDTANGIVADIQRYLRHEPVSARPPSTPYLLQKLVRRHRVGFSAAAAVAGMLVVGIALSTWQALRATRAENAALISEHNELRLRQRAEAQELIARQRAYAADMYLAQQMLAADNHVRVRELLRQHVPRSDQRDLRGWEWRYLWQESSPNGGGELLGKNPGVIWSMSSSSDGTWLALGNYWWAAESAGVVTVWDLRRRQKFERRIGDASTRVKFSPRAPLLAMSGCRRDDPTRSWIELWNVATDQMERRLELGEPCAGIAFSDDGNTLVTATFTDVRYAENRWLTISRWRIRDGFQLRTYRAPETTFSSSAEYPFVVSSDLQLAAYPTQSGNEFRVIDLDTGLQRWSARLDGLPTALAFSPDARLIVASGGYGAAKIRFWDVANGREVGPPLEGHQTAVEALVFWPDGKTLASAGRDRSIRLWDVPSRRQVSLLTGHQSGVFELEILPGQGLLVSGDQDGLIRLWQPKAARERPVASIVLENVSGWQFATNSHSVVMSHRDLSLAERTIPGFEVKRTIEIDRPATLRDHLNRKRVFNESVVFARDRPLIAIGSRDGIVWVFDFERRIQLAEIKISSGHVYPEVFLASGRRLIIYDARSSPPVFHEWDLARGSEIAAWTGSERYGSFTITPDERHALILGPDGVGQVREMMTGTSRAIQLPMGAVSGAGFSSDGRLLAVTSRAGYAKVWQFPDEIQTAALLSDVLNGASAAFAPDTSRLAMGCGGPQVMRLWDMESHLPVLSFDGARGTFNQTAFSSDGRTLGSLSHVGRLCLWFAPSWSEMAAMEQAARPTAER